MLPGGMSARRRRAFTWPPVLGPVHLAIPLGGTGEWDATDANNPNVAFDPVRRRWFIHYTGHLHGSTPEVSEEQKVGQSWGPTPSGPWVKDAANPTFAEANPSGYSMNGGLTRLHNGLWLHAYKGNGAVRFATSPDLYAWTVLPSFLTTGNDAFLRTKPDGRVECYQAEPSDGNDPYGRTMLRVCRRYTSSDNGMTWVRDPGIFGGYAPEFVLDGPGWGEFSVWHQPGYEDERMIFLSDAQVAGLGSWQARANVMGRTVDGGATWDWVEINRPTRVAGDWNKESVFDTFPLIAHDKFYLFFAGSPTYTPLLDGDIQIGYRVAEWDPASMVEV